MNDCKKAMMIPIHKNWEFVNCSNFRRLPLLYTDKRNMKTGKNREELLSQLLRYKRLKDKYISFKQEA